MVGVCNAMATCRNGNGRTELFNYDIMEINPTEIKKMLNQLQEVHSALLMLLDAYETEIPQHRVDPVAWTSDSTGLDGTEVVHKDANGQI